MSHRHWHGGGCTSAGSISELDRLRTKPINVTMPSPALKCRRVDTDAKLGRGAMLAGDGLLFNHEIVLQARICWLDYKSLPS